MKPSSLGISIATRNRWRDVEKTLAKIAERAEFNNCPIMVVDDGSAQPVPRTLSEQYPRVDFRLSEECLGATAQRSRIVELMKTDYVLQLDDDSYPIRGSVSEAIAFMESHADVAALALKIMEGNPNISAGDSTKPPYKVRSFIGCGVILRRKMFLELGGFAGALVNYTEERHFCANAIREGNATYMFPSLVIRHEKSSSARSTAKTAYYKGRNRVLLALWHYPLRTIPFRLATSLPGVLVLVRPRDYPSAVVGFLMGIFDGIRMLGQRRPLTYRQYLSWRGLPPC
jgi:GT2 family glycosyltransferase